MHHRSHDQEGHLHPGGSASKWGCLHPGGGSTSREGLHPGGGWAVSLQGGWADPPPEIHGILRDMVKKRAVRILLLKLFLSQGKRYKVPKQKHLHVTIVLAELKYICEN